MMSPPDSKGRAGECMTSRGAPAYLTQLPQFGQYLTTPYLSSIIYFILFVLLVFKCYKDAGQAQTSLNGQVFILHSRGAFDFYFQASSVALRAMVDKLDSKYGWIPGLPCAQPGMTFLRSSDYDVASKWLSISPFHFLIFSKNKSGPFEPPYYYYWIFPYLLSLGTKY